MGLIIGWAAILYVRALYKAEDLFGAWRFPDYLKPAVGGLMAGLVLRYFPDVYGAGFPAVESALWVRFPWELLIGLFVAEFLANCATPPPGPAPTRWWGWRPSSRRPRKRRPRRF